ncbi:MAG: hypothetical protein A2086_07475 [Spirochaetes bacterium GWD1_27_9]|nr:MAG: hypothetical protein A2Z98_18120 [Spirochaetes bacterium GWB1_27_13]OHD27947.1 MAG: hypothetical protein A2Y34_13310 [Spirochaetes bacterium GWC1_27_15]OHD44773.1 MAG: hypothetical protein A2086_07475 [Spirochaetes bacterium GWD1_27_9]
MKNLMLFVFFIFVLFSCGYSEVRKENLTRPTFENEKRIYLERFAVEFIPTYYVWTTKYSEFMDLEDAKEGTLFKVVKKLSLIDNIFTVEDIKNKDKITLRQVSKKDNTTDLVFYNIYDNNSLIGEIKQSSNLDFDNFDLFYKGKQYLISGKTNKFQENIINSFNFTISDDKEVLSHIFREYYYLKNEYEIIINKNKEEIPDMVFIATGVFLDQILRSQGYDYKN